MNGTFFQFYSPYYLLLWLLVMPLFLFDVRKLRFLQFPASSVQVFSKTKKGIRAPLEFVPPLLRFIAMTLLVVAIARPQWGNKFTEIDSEGIDMILALDASGSMVAEDFQLDGQPNNRLEVVKSVVSNFIDGRHYDRIGMVVFGTQAYTQCPLTLDYGVLKNYLEMLEIGIAGDNTAIGNAIATGVKRLQKSKAKSRVLVLLTDGENTAGEISPLKAAELAGEAGIKIYTIAVGKNGMVPVPVKTYFGVRRVMQEVSIDEGLLRQIASETGGEFFQATDTDALKKIYETIDKLEKTEVKVNQFTEFQEMYLTFLIPAVFLFLAAWVLQKTVFMRIP